MIKSTLLVSPISIGLAVIAVLLLGAGGFIGYTINKRLDEDIFFQPRGEIVETPVDYGMDHETFLLETEDGLKLNAWWVPGTSNDGIVMAPGYTDSMSIILKYGPFLNQAGYNLLFFDPRGQSESEGELYAFGAFQKLDIEAGMKHMREVRGMENVALFGHSNGASAALITAADHPYPEVFAVISDSAFANLKLASQSPEYTDPFLEALFPMYTWVAQLRLGFDVFDKTNVLTVIEQVSHAIFIHGTADEGITYNNSELLYELAQEPKELWLLEGVEHVQSIDTEPDLYAEKVLNFLNSVKP